MKINDHNPCIHDWHPIDVNEGQNIPEIKLECKKCKKGLILKTGKSGFTISKIDELETKESMPLSSLFIVNNQ